MSDSKEAFDAVVVGGGLSGCSAAVYLRKRGARVLLVEARDRVGGRTCTEKLKSGSWVDHGGAYVGPTQNRLLRVAQEFGIETYPIFSPPDHKSVMSVGGKRKEYIGTIPSFHPLALLDLNNAIVAIDRLAFSVPLDNPWDAEDAEMWDSMTAEEWLNSMTWTQAAKTAVTGFVQAILCVEPSEVSMLYLLFYVHSGGGVMNLTDVPNGAQERKFVGGTQQISEALLKYLIGKGGRGPQGEALLSTPVESIQQDSGGITVTSRDGKTFSAAYCVVALAPAMYGKLHFQPALPPAKRFLSQHMPMGTIIKTFTQYSKPFWREKGFTGILFSDEGPVSYTYDDCHGDKFGLMGFVLSRHVRAVQHSSGYNSSDNPEQWLAKRVCRQYAKVFESDEALKPVKFYMKDWNAEEFSGGCYVGVMGPRVMTDVRAQLRTPAGRVHFAGTETASQWAGYMDGAIQAGERAAHNILRRLARGNHHKIKDPGDFQWQEPTCTLVPKKREPDLAAKYLPNVPTFFAIIFAFVAVVVYGFVLNP